MRIESFDRVSQIYRVGQTSKVANVRGVAAAGRDKLSISRTGQDYQIAKQAVKDAPDIREDKVSDLKSRIESGSYEVSAKDFATHLMEQYNAVWGA